MASIPAEVAALLGPDPADHSGRGSGSVLAGNGHVARIGPPEIVAREAFVLGVDGFPLTVPRVVATGPGFWAVDAASVVWFFAYDVPQLEGAPPWLAEHMVSLKVEAAHRVLG